MPAKKIAKSKRRVRVTVSLSPALVKRLQAFARMNGTSVSREVERYLEGGLGPP